MICAKAAKELVFKHRKEEEEILYRKIQDLKKDADLIIKKHASRGETVGLIPRPQSKKIENLLVRELEQVGYTVGTHENKTSLRISWA
jgi:hypothetical protein